MPLIMPSPRTGKVPQIHESAFIAPTAVIIGDVTIGEGSNIWFGAVLSETWSSLFVERNTSIQENVTIHNQVGSTVDIGDDCIIGHHAMIHGPCTIGNGCLVGIGANVLHGSKMGEGAIIGAGGVLIGKEIPPRTLAVGVPATIKKQLPQKGKMEGAKTSGEYAKNGNLFKQFFEKNLERSNL